MTTPSRGGLTPVELRPSADDLRLQAFRTRSLSKLPASFGIVLIAGVRALRVGVQRRCVDAPEHAPEHDHPSSCRDTIIWKSSGYAQGRDYGQSVLHAVDEVLRGGG